MRLNVPGACFAVLLFWLVPPASTQAQTSKDTHHDTNPGIPLKVGDDVTAPRHLYGYAPEYSEEARKAGTQGSCLLSLVVDSDGKPHEIRVERGVGMGLDEKAVEAVSHWIFEPARKNGKPVAVQIQVEIGFRLYNDPKEMFSPEQLEQMSQHPAPVEGQIYRDTGSGKPRACSPLSSVNGEQRSLPVATVAELSFEGSLLMTASEQGQISDAIKQATFSGDRAQVTSQVVERAKAAWQGRGYSDVQVAGDTTILSSSPANERVAVTVHVDEGPQYRLQRIQFNNNEEVSNSTALRSLFPIKDGDIFNSALVREGIENLRKAYFELGHVNFTSIPNTIVDEPSQTVLLNVDVYEGKKFFVSRIDIMGLDEPVFQNVIKDLAFKPGDVYDQRLVHLFIEQHVGLLPSNASPDSDIDLRLDERAGTVAITYDFRPCGVS